MPILFDANYEYISIANNSKWTFTPVADNRGLSLYWFSSSLPSEHQTLLYIDQSSGNKIQMSVANNSGTIILLVILSNSAWSTIGAMYGMTSLSANTLYHIVFNLSTDNSSEIWVNNNKYSVYYNNWSVGATITPDNVRINSGITIFGNMTLSHITWRDDIFTSSEVASLYNNPYNALSMNGILSYFPLDEQTGIYAYDRVSTNVTNGTLINSPTWTTNPWVRYNIAGAANPFKIAGLNLHAIRKVLGI